MELMLNEKIKASELEVTGLQGESLGVMSREDALALAKRHHADLLCLSLMSSPPPCKLVPKGMANQTKQQDKRKSEGEARIGKLKEIRLSANIEQHDFETKQRQISKLLDGGDAVQLVVRIKGNEGPAAKELLERMLTALAGVGAKESGIQLSGKQAAVRVNPLS
ncbi:translation initiation factor IF-3 [Paenibacillaceae bacterium]|nr:translation initiation factor IF-3 [Paenibacillaceae bacterium]